MERRQILIVDDYPGARYLRSRILSEAGYEVIEASTGTEALKLAQTLRPALILLDVNLPDISGFEVCEQLKQDPATAHIPVVQITGAWLSEDARQQGMASGANAYLVEPVDDVTLLRSVVMLIESLT
ncbi:MAG TPA: response regulator [Vicinamibacterales bacterium]|jgi:CheY-like chemotaxis protein|nr:response regulator [Vicinamibacterales bacterium]